MRLYIAVLDEFPDYMTPTLVAHSVLGAHMLFTGNKHYDKWLSESFKKCVVRVNRAEFEKILKLRGVYIGQENNTMNGESSCAVVIPYENDKLPNVLKYAKLWKPEEAKSEIVEEHIQKLDLSTPGLYIAKTNGHVAKTRIMDFQRGLENKIKKFSKNSEVIIMGPEFGSISKELKITL